MFYRCFFLFFYVFFVRHKNTRQLFSGTAERIFTKLLPNDSGENAVCIAVPKWGLGPPINFMGAKNYTLHTWWWRLTSNSELVCWLWHCAVPTAVALKGHERVNAFNLVETWNCSPRIVDLGPKFQNGVPCDSAVCMIIHYNGRSPRVSVRNFLLRERDFDRSDICSVRETFAYCCAL